MKRIFLTSLLLYLFSSFASAEVYKCTIDGVETYSQDPCGEETTVANITPPPLQSEKVDKSDILLQCLKVLKVTKLWKDPDSVKLEGHFTDWISDSSGARRVLVLMINAKNSYGGYGGAERHECFLNAAGTRLSKVQRRVY